jgi:hypothetical protein
MPIFVHRGKIKNFRGYIQDIKKGNVEVSPMKMKEEMLEVVNQKARLNSGKMFPKGHGGK